MRRGITPVVAVAILLGMTVAGSAGAYTFFTQVQQEGLDEASTSLSTELTVRSARCEDTSATIGISNTGDRELVADSASVFLFQDGTLLDTVEKDISGADVLQPGGFSQLQFPFTTYLSPGTRYTVEVSFDDADYSFERTCQGQTGDLVGYWNFDTITSRTIADATVHGNSGTFHGMDLNGTMEGLLHNGTLGSSSGSDSSDPAWETDCAERDCLDFDGTDHVTVPDHPDLDITDAVTVMAWVEPRTGTNHSRLMDDDGFNIYWESGVADRTERPLRIYIKGDDGQRHYTDGIDREPLQNISAGDRVHVAATFNGTHLRQYHDGAVVAWNNWTGSMEDGTADLLIGAMGAGDPRKWNGTIDDVRIYDRALGQDEVQAAWQGEAPRDGVVAYYPFDEGEGQTAYNGVYQAAGRHGQAARFDGSTGRYLEVPDADALDLDESFTWTVWANLREKSGDDTVFGKEDAYELTIRNSDMKIVSWGDDWHPSYTFPVGEWHHIAVTGNGAGTSRTLYIDGEQVASGGPSYTMSVSGNPLQIGRWPGQDGNGVNGSVDDLRIYDRELSQSDIRDDMNGEAPKSGIVASYSMDGPTGRTVWNDAFWQEGKDGGAVAFDESKEQFVRVADDTALNVTGEVTVAAWMHSRYDWGSSPSNRGIVDKFDGDGYVLWIKSNGRTRFVTCTGGTCDSTDINGGLSAEVDAWTHVVGTFNGSHIVTYMDGEMDETVTATGLAPQARPLEIGRARQQSSRTFDGRLDEIRVYDSALSTQQVQALYNATR